MITIPLRQICKKRKKCRTKNKKDLFIKKLFGTSTQKLEKIESSHQAEESKTIVNPPEEEGQATPDFLARKQAE